MNALSELAGALDDALTACGLDRRLCYASVRPLPPDGATVIVESSDATVLETVRARAPDLAAGVRFELLPHGDAPPAFVVTSSVADMRREPSHAAELTTQMICGDALATLKVEGDWVLGHGDDGYVGWIRAWHLAPTTFQAIDQFRQRARHRVAVNTAEVLDTPSSEALPAGELVVGSLVHVSGYAPRGWRHIHLPDGRQGFVRGRALCPYRHGARAGRARLAQTGMRFLGIPYIWGGTTPKGFDCSGLIQRVYRLNGLALPRDADMQSRYGRRREDPSPATLETGDLMFFGADAERITHVAMVLSEGHFLHAYGQVRVGTLDPRHRLFEPRLAEIYRFAADPLDPGVL